MVIFSGGGAYWAGRGAALPLFAPNGQAMMFALSLFALLKF